MACYYCNSSAHGSDVCPVKREKDRRLEEERAHRRKMERLQNEQNQLLREQAKEAERRRWQERDEQYKARALREADEPSTTDAADYVEEPTAPKPRLSIAERAADEALGSDVVSPSNETSGKDALKGLFWLLVLAILLFRTWKKFMS